MTFPAESDLAASALVKPIPVALDAGLAAIGPGLAAVEAGHAAVETGGAEEDRA